jgi:hypothetical protein
MRSTPVRHPRGRPASKKDKNRRPVPVRADRDRPIQWFFDAVPRPGLDDALLMSGDERFYRLHSALQDEVYRTTSPGTLCRNFGISFTDLVRLWWNHNLLWGKIQMLNHLPDIMEDIAVDALSREGPCPRCDGIGHVMRESGQAPCPVCDGAGKVRVPGDAHARRLLFEIIGLIGPRRRGPAST